MKFLSILCFVIVSPYVYAGHCEGFYEACQKGLVDDPACATAKPSKSHHSHENKPKSTQPKVISVTHPSGAKVISVDLPEKYKQ